LIENLFLPFPSFLVKYNNLHHTHVLVPTLTHPSLPGTYLQRATTVTGNCTFQLHEISLHNMLNANHI
jgi:hypothetical protein